MTDIYVQREEVALRKGARRDQILGMVLQLAGLGLIPVAVFFSYWVFFAVAVALAGGIWLTQRFYSSPKEYEYAFTGTKLVVSRANIAGRGRRMLEIALSDVRSFTGFYDILTERDFLAAESANMPEIKAMTFAVGDGVYRLLFAPDDYMTALISEKLRAGRTAGGTRTEGK